MMRKLSNNTVFCVRILCATAAWMCLVSAIAFAQDVDVPESTPEENTILLRRLAEQEYQQAEWAFERVTQDIMDLADENAALDVDFTGNTSQDSDAHEHHWHDGDAGWQDGDGHECHEKHGEEHWQDGDIHECHRDHGDGHDKQDAEMLKEDTENEIR